MNIRSRIYGVGGGELMLGTALTMGEVSRNKDDQMGEIFSWGPSPEGTISQLFEFKYCRISGLCGNNRNASAISEVS